MCTNQNSVGERPHVCIDTTAFTHFMVANMYNKLNAIVVTK